jgi:hypothetical protein
MEQNYTKRIFSVLILIIFLIVLIFYAQKSSYSENLDENIELYEIHGRYCQTINGTSLLLSTNDGPICLSPINDDLFNDFEIGDEIEISISGVGETYPGQAIVFDCELINKGTINDLDYDDVQNLIEMGYDFSFELEKS